MITGHAWPILLLLLAMAKTSYAQPPAISSRTAVNPEILQKWLHSADPRQIAWAATFARQTHDAKVIAELPGWLEHCSIPPQTYKLDEPEPAQRLAVIAVLDTLIQENIQVPIPAIETVAPYFPALPSSNCT